MVVMNSAVGCRGGLFMDTHLHHQLSGALELQGQGVGSVRGQRLPEIEQHDMVAAGYELDAFAGCDFHALDLLHLHQITLVDMFVQLGVTRDRSADPDQGIRLLPMVLYDHVSRAGGGDRGQGAGPGVLHPEVSRLIIVGMNHSDKAAA
jgi:hypothetical protein